MTEAPREIYNLIKCWLLEMGFVILNEEPEEEIVLVSDNERDIAGLMLDCEKDILIMQQLMGNLPAEMESIGSAAAELMVMNADMVHGAFKLNKDMNKVFWWDTIEISSLTKEEVMASINALSLIMAKHGERLTEILQ